MSITSIETQFADAVLNIGEVSEIIGSRIFPVVAPIGTDTPFVTYRRTPNEVGYTQSGESSVQKARMQVSVVCEHYDEAIDLAAKLRAGLSGVRGVVGTGSVIFFQDPSDDWNRESGLFVRTQECIINFKV